MPDYDYAEFSGRPFSQRFPEWALGSDLWREYGNGGVETIQRLLNGLVLSRVSANWGHSQLRCPRIFVSHRQADDVRAREIATLARKKGFQVWLDVEDALLRAIAGQGSPFGGQKAALTAAIIEMALLNSSHVIAVMTKHTAGSTWVPYEYGRVKDSSLYSLQAGCWIDSGLRPSDLGEYLLLGVTTSTDAEIELWLERELASWRQQFKTCVAGASAEDAAHPPAPHVPDPEVNPYAQIIMKGTARPVRILRPLTYKTTSST